MDISAENKTAQPTQQDMDDLSDIISNTANNSSANATNQTTQEDINDISDILNTAGGDSTSETTAAV